MRHHDDGATAGELSDAAAWYHADVTDQRALDAAVTAAVAHFGRIDIVITNAGIASMGTVAMIDVEAMARVINGKAVGTMRTVKATLPHRIASRGSVLIVSSATAVSAMPGLSAYASSKVAVEQSANVLRIEMAAHGVDVGSAHMTWIDTDMVRDAQQDLPGFRRTLSRLPGAFGVITALERCVDAVARGCDTRARKMFVPGSLGVASAARQRRRDVPHARHDGIDEQRSRRGDADGRSIVRHEQRGDEGVAVAVQPATASLSCSRCLHRRNPGRRFSEQASLLTRRCRHAPYAVPPMC